MNVEEFRIRGKEMVDLVADYLANIRDRRTLSDVQPGYLRHLIPAHAPQQPDSWESLLTDIQRVIMPGVTHWQSPHFHAYYPIAHSYPSICADILSEGIAAFGVDWASSPAYVELETTMMDWLAQMLTLPDKFLSYSKGGGIIQSSASEVTLVTLLAARNRTLNAAPPNDADGNSMLSRLVAYCSDESHCSVEKACLMGAVRCHKVKSNEFNEMTGKALAEAIDDDKCQGLVPFYCVATLGTTSTCAFDKLLEVGPVCEENDVWLHVDAAYAGSAFICPEFRLLLNGVEMAQSFNFNAHKWLRVNFDCSPLWYGDISFVNSFKVDAAFFNRDQPKQMPDYKHWEIQLGRRFRALKVWFVLRLFGVDALQAHIRKQVGLAREFEKLVKTDDVFEVTHEVKMGLVCFRVKGAANEVTNKLMKAINADGRIHVLTSSSKGIEFLRFAVCAAETELADIQFAWETIRHIFDRLLRDNN